MELLLFASHPRDRRMEKPLVAVSMPCGMSARIGNACFLFASHNNDLSPVGFCMVAVERVGWRCVGGGGGMGELW